MMQALGRLAQKDVAENADQNRQETMSPPTTTNSNPTAYLRTLQNIF